MKCHIIHDSKRTDRMPNLNKEIDEQGLDVQLWEAEFVPKKPFAGVMKAHKKIVAWAKEQGLPEVCIMEDDIKFAGPGAWQYYLDNKPDDFDIYLGGIYSGTIARGVTKDFSALHLYIVHERFYDTFLAVPEGNHLDRGLAGKGRYVVCYPYAATQYGGFSDNSRSIRTNKIDAEMIWRPTSERTL
jgi:hypothetical protein